MKEKLGLFIERLKKAFSKESIKSLFEKKNRATFIAVCSVAAVILATVIIGVVYVNDYYHADVIAIGDFLENEMVSSSFNIDESGLIVATPGDEIKAGLIFYPGGKVEHTAYLPLMIALAERGILCVLTPMPCRLAVLDVNAAEEIFEKFPQVDSWYIGGHSLGGSMAASYLSKNTDKLDGLVLLGSYSTADVSDSHVITILGTEDEVTNMKKYENNKVNIPIGCEEVLITGGNHAYFGMYGEQKGDGIASITPAEQITRAAYRIADFILNR